MSADPRPTLRDAIADGVSDYDDELGIPGEDLVFSLEHYIEKRVTAWLSVVSEQEQEAAAVSLWETGIAHNCGSWDDADEFLTALFRRAASDVLTAARGCLLGHEETHP